MSIVIALRVNEGVVLAADRRVTVGDPRSIVCTDDDFKKVITFKYGAIGFVNAVGFVTYPLNAALDKINAQNYADDPLMEISLTLKNHYALYRSNASKAERKRIPEVKLVYADIFRTARRIYTLDSETDFMPNIFNPEHAIIGIRNYASYLYKRFWHHSFNINDAARFAVLLINETAFAEPKVGGVVNDIVKITHSGIEIVSQSDMEIMINENTEFVKAFAKSFMH